MSPLWANAQQAAKSAQLLLDERYYDGASDRAFFAMFNASRALLASRGMNAGAIRSHTKVRALLARHFVEAKCIEPELVNALRRADKARRIANMGSGVEREVAHSVVEAMDRFMHRVSQFLIPEKVS